MKPAPERPAWSPMHDLTLLYLALAHGTDADMDPAESEEIQLKLKVWFPDVSPSVIQKATDEVMLVYMGSSRDAMVELSAASLREVLVKDERIGVLNDLADLASADGTIVPNEVLFIQKLAQYWDVEKDVL